MLNIIISQVTQLFKNITTNVVNLNFLTHFNKNGQQNIRLSFMKVFDFIVKHIVFYPTSGSLSYLWGFGSLVGLMLASQLVTGIILAMSFQPSASLVFESVLRIVNDVPNGGCLRSIHANVASFFFLIIYIYIGHSLYYGSLLGLRVWIWITGLIIFLLMMGTDFLGYFLPWGQIEEFYSYYKFGQYSAIILVIYFVVVKLMSYLSQLSIKYYYAYLRLLNLCFVLYYIFCILLFMHYLNQSIVYCDNSTDNNNVSLYMRLYNAIYNFFTHVIYGPEQVAVVSEDKVLTDADIYGVKQQVINYFYEAKPNNYMELVTCFDSLDSMFTKICTFDERYSELYKELYHQKVEMLKLEKVKLTQAATSSSDDNNNNSKGWFSYFSNFWTKISNWFYKSNETTNTSVGSKPPALLPPSPEVSPLSSPHTETSSVAVAKPDLTVAASKSQVLLYTVDYKSTKPPVLLPPSPEVSPSVSPANGNAAVKTVQFVVASSPQGLLHSEPDSNESEIRAFILVPSSSDVIPNQADNRSVNLIFRKPPVLLPPSPEVSPSVSPLHSLVPEVTLINSQGNSTDLGIRKD